MKFKIPIQMIQDKTFAENLKPKRKNKAFAENLRRKRIEKGFTQKTIADELEIFRQRYAKWEEEGVWPPCEYLIRLVEVLEVDDMYLFLSKELVEN